MEESHMNKRFTAWLLTGAMCLCQLSPLGNAVYAGDSGQYVTATSQIAGTGASALSPGDKFYVDVSLSPVSSCAFALNATWDTDELELTNAVSGSSFCSGSAVPSTYVPFYKDGSSTVPEQALTDYVSDKADDVCVFAYAAGDNLSCSGVAVTLEFTVKQDAENGISEVNVYFDKNDPPKYFGSNHEEIDINVSESSDPERDGRVEAEITGGKEIPTGLLGLTFGNSQGTLEPEFSQSVREYTFTVPSFEADIPKVEAVTNSGVKVEIDQATDFSTDSTAVIRTTAKRTNVYKVRFVKQSKASAPVIMPASGEIARNTLISITGSANDTIYYTTDGSDPDITNASQIYSRYFTADSIGIPAGTESLTVKAVAVHEGLEPSEIAEAVYELPGYGAKASAIKIGGKAVSGFNPDVPFVMYQISYEEWAGGNNKYTIEALPYDKTAEIEYVPGNVVSFDCNADGQGSGDTKEIEVRISTADGSFANYYVYFTVAKCAHRSFREVTTAPTCEEPGIYTFSCRTCGKIYDQEIESPALGHDPGEPVIVDADCVTEGSMTVFCQREDCGKKISEEIIPALGHTPGEAVTVPATCGTEGSVTISCAVCGSEISKEILAPTGNHEWIYFDEDTQQCAVCGATQDIEIPPVIEHEHKYDGEEEIISEATCTAEGSRSVKCSVTNCGSYIVEIIPMIPHSEVTKTTEPTCTTTGLVTVSCDVCGTVISETVTDALGHSFTFEDKAPDCTDIIVLEAVCTVCGTVGYKTIDPVGHHDFDEKAWKTDENGHCHVCSICGDNVDVGIHTEGEGVITKEATAEAEGEMTYYCTECGYEMRTAVLPMLPPEVPDDPQPPVHEHSFSKEWSKDGTQHWHECSCGEKADVSDHSASAAWTVDDTKHWKACSVCGAELELGVHTENEGKITVPATETSEGIMTYSCTDCGTVLREESIDKLPHEHSYTFEYQGSAEGHWLECTDCGEKTPVIPHTEDNGTATTPATETSEGVMTYTCTVCGYITRTEVIPKLAPSHTHSYAAYASDNSGHWQICECGDVTASEPHVEDGGEVIWNATEDFEGTMQYSCVICGYRMRMETIPKLPKSHTHSFQSVYQSDSTAHWQVCECGEIGNYEEHIENDGEVILNATEDSEGIMKYSCTVCGAEIRTEDIPKLAPSHTHSFRSAYQSDNAAHWQVCECGEIGNFEEHKWDTGVVVSEPDDENNGVILFTCQVCGAARTQFTDKTDPGADDNDPGTDNKPEVNIPPVIGEAPDIVDESTGGTGSAYFEPSNNTSFEPSDNTSADAGDASEDASGSGEDISSGAAAFDAVEDIRLSTKDGSVMWVIALGMIGMAAVSVLVKKKRRENGK